MADFVKLSIFGTVFEVSSRRLGYACPPSRVESVAHGARAWGLGPRQVTTRYVDLQPVGMGAFGLVCSAKDEVSIRSVHQLERAQTRARSGLWWCELPWPSSD